MPKFDVFA